MDSESSFYMAFDIWSSYNNLFYLAVIIADIEEAKNLKEYYE